MQSLGLPHLKACPSHDYAKNRCANMEPHVLRSGRRAFRWEEESFRQRALTAYSCMGPFDLSQWCGGGGGGAV